MKYKLRTLSIHPEAYVWRCTHGMSHGCKIESGAWKPFCICGCIPQSQEPVGQSCPASSGVPPLTVEITEARRYVGNLPSREGGCWDAPWLPVYRADQCLSICMGGLLKLLCHCLGPWAHSLCAPHEVDVLLWRKDVGLLCVFPIRLSIHPSVRIFKSSAFLLDAWKICMKISSFYQCFFNNQLLNTGFIA